MSIQRASKCCVCGEPTTKRCQACAKSGIDLFFCSPEHQKLVWKHHKEVCGPNANPFRYPPLSTDEANLLRSYAHDVVDLSEYKNTSTVKIFPNPVMTVATYVETLSLAGTGNFGVLLQHLQKPGPANDSFHATALAAARGALSSAGALRDNRTIQLSDGTVWSHISAFCAEACGRALTPEDRNDSYQFGKKLPHALCILFALLTVRQEKGCDAVPPAWIFQTLETAADCYADIQPFPSASEAVAALGSLADLIMPIQPLRLVGVKDRQTGKISVKCVR